MYKFLSALALCFLSGGALAPAAATGGDPVRGNVPAAPLWAGPASLPPMALAPTATASWRAGPSLAENMAGTRAVPRSARDRAPAAPGQTAGTPKKGGTSRYADCVGLWDAGTHMSKRDWSRTCRRIENRLESLQVETLDVDRSAPVRKKGRSPDAG